MSNIDWSTCVSSCCLNVPQGIALSDLEALPQTMPEITYISAPLFEAGDDVWDLLLSAERFPNLRSLVVYEGNFSSPQVHLLSRFSQLTTFNAEGCRGLTEDDHRLLDERFPGRPKRY